MLTRALLGRSRKSLWNGHHQLVSHRTLVLGLMRETYNPWERRAPLCPEHVSKLLSDAQKNNPSPSSSTTCKVLVQPSELRIFSDKQYEQAGAIVTHDLSEADLILGVKRPKHHSDLLPNKTYTFFSHVIKGQPENMALLRHVLDNNIQLLDYECIVQDHERIVAFGKFAGIAGTNDALHALGRRLLCHGYSTPFLHIPPAYTYNDWEDTKRRLHQVGEQIKDDGGCIRTPYPIIVSLTGHGGKAHSGALAVMKELPVKFVSVQDLPKLIHQSGPHSCIYCVSVGVSDLFVDKNNKNKPFEWNRYEEHPEEFVSIFCDKIAPYTTVLVNCQYWDERFPRLLTKQAIQRIANTDSDQQAQPQIVADVSCDIHGSIEFLHRTTTVERPYFEYDALNDQEITDDVTGEGITVAGVDILPSELPKDSSEHFGDALFPLILSAIEKEKDKRGESLDYLPTELRNACITTSDGKFMDRFKYIETLMSLVMTTTDDENAGAHTNTMVLNLNGHVFDSGLINQSLDVIEAHGCRFEIVNCSVRRHQKSLVVVQVSASDMETLDTVHEKIQSLAEIVVGADTHIRRSDGKGGMHQSCSNKMTRPRTNATVVQNDEKEERVLVLGSGMVSKSTVEYLGRQSLGRKVVVAGVDETEVRDIASHITNGEHVVLDAKNDLGLLADQIDKSDLVVSLLPARFHPMVAETCIGKAKNFVTASYESEAMRQLHYRAQAAGITILNEVGLDPGLDHMSAMRVIDSIHERGGTVSRFESYCGGLPSPTAAAGNPLRYKFSWSPRGVLEACLNDARFKSKGGVFQVSGDRLLSSVTPFSSKKWSQLDLECLPNRDSLIYLNKYGIPSAETCFRGTLRYSGYSALMDVFKTMGMLEDSPASAATWKQWIDLQRRRKTGGSLYDLLLHAAHDNIESANRALECCKYLGLFEDVPLSDPDSVINSFSTLLAEKLRYGADEFDMVVMQHEIVGLMSDGDVELHTSSMQAFGDKDMSAMAKTVGYTTAVGAELLLNKHIAETGSLLPIKKHIYSPMLDRLAEENIKFEEDCRHLNQQESSAELGEQINTKSFM